MCKRIASLLVAKHPEALLASADKPKAATRIALDKQPRYARTLVSEFCSQEAWALPVRDEQLIKPLLECYPKGAKVTARQLFKWGFVRVCVRPVGASVSRVEEIDWCSVGVSAKIGDSELPLSDVPGESGRSDLVLVRGSFQEMSGAAGTHAEVVWIGVPREPQDFVKRAIMSGHPRNNLLASVTSEAGLVPSNSVHVEAL